MAYKLVDFNAAKGLAAGGMTGVPGYLLNRRLLVVGAQATDTLIGAFDRAMFGEGDDELQPPSLH